MVDWFRNKKYGYGWTPNTWQGWLVVALFGLYIYYYRSTTNLILAIILLLFIGYLKGPKPKWSWG